MDYFGVAQFASCQPPNHAARAVRGFQRHRLTRGAQRERMRLAAFAAGESQHVGRGQFAVNHDRRPTVEQVGPRGDNQLDPGNKLFAGRGANRPPYGVNTQSPKRFRRGSHQIWAVRVAIQQRLLIAGALQRNIESEQIACNRLAG